MREIAGIAASPGILVANAFRYFESSIPTEKAIIRNVDEEINRLKAAIERTKDKLLAFKEKVAHQLGEDEGKIYSAQILVLEDPVLSSAIYTQIEEGVNAEYAVQEVTAIYTNMFEILGNDYMKERATGVRDVMGRLVAELMNKEEGRFATLQNEVILIVEDLTPSITIQLDQRWIKGIITDNGSATSHAAILARAMGIPAVVGTQVASKEIEDGALIILDGTSGKILLNATKEEQQLYQQKIQLSQLKEQEYQINMNIPAQTKDGHLLKILGNIDSLTDAERVLANGGQGIGLLRTEFLYMNRDDAPSEEEQFNLYKSILEKFNGNPVIIRSLDIGGDKEVDYLNLEKEMNPFLGNRAIRLSLNQLDIFRIQLRALLRASNFGNLKIMFPMICTLEELQEVKAVLLEEKECLLKQGQAIGGMEVGMMIETPAAALHAAAFAKEVDFFSIETNNLIQYTFAADRMNERVSYLYQPYHPVILKQIQTIVNAAHQHDKWVGICGEMASNPITIPLLLGLGVDELSMHASFIPKAKYQIHGLSYEELKAHIHHILTLTTSNEVKVYLSSHNLC